MPVQVHSYLLNAYFKKSNVHLGVFAGGLEERSHAIAGQKNAYPKPTDSVLSFATVFMSFNAPDLQIGKYCHPKGTVLTLAQPKTKNFRLIPRRPQNITYVLLHLGGYKKSDVCTLYPLLVRKVDQNHLGQTL